MMTEEQLARMFQSLPEPKPVVLKLYYDDAGQPIVYSCDMLDGNYIEVDAETFAIASMQVRVVNGVLKHMPITVYSNKLVPGTSGVMCHFCDVSIVVNNNGTYWKKHTYGNNQ